MESPNPSHAGRIVGKKDSALSERPPGAGDRVPKTVVFGSGGFLGSRFLSAYRRTHPDAVGAGRSSGDFRFDLENPDFSAVDPAVNPAMKGCENALIAAAIGDVRVCETRPDFSRRVNVEGTLALAERLADLGIKPIFLSSDYVFEGSRGGYGDSSPTRPATEYGKQKVEVENALPHICADRYLVLRLSKVMGADPGDGSILDQMAKGLREGKTVSAAHDQVFCPTFAGDIVRIALELQSRDATGIYNLAAPEALSRLEMARRIASGLGADPSLIRSISIDDLGEPFRRPKRTDMVCERLRALGSFAFADVDQCVGMYLGGDNSGKERPR